MSRLLIAAAAVGMAVLVARPAAAVPDHLKCYKIKDSQAKASYTATLDGLTVLCSLHQVDLAIDWADRIVGLRHGQVVLDTDTSGLDKAQVMEIYGRVATSTGEIQAMESELMIAEPVA